MKRKIPVKDRFFVKDGIPYIRKINNGVPVFTEEEIDEKIKALEKAFAEYRKANPTRKTPDSRSD
jgi:hypothetical protein